MKLHIVTIGRPKLAYAQVGFNEYVKRLERLQDVRVSHIADRHNDTDHILKVTEGSHRVAMVIDGPQFTSEGLAHFLKKRELEAKEVSFIIGGPEGLPQQVIDSAETKMGLSKLTFPHDLAMVVLAETLYRSSSINNSHPYHK